MLTPEELTALRAKAEAATPGPWKPDYRQMYVFDEAEVNICCQIRGYGDMAYTHSDAAREAQMRANNAFIAAANPATVLQLLNRIDFLEKEVVSYKWVAKQAWGGEIPSPYPGHHSSYEKFIENMEHHNCPCCGGSGHVDDCDKDLVDKIERLEKEADWLADNLTANCNNKEECYTFCPSSLKRWGCHAVTVSDWRKAARKAVEEDTNDK